MLCGVTFLKFHYFNCGLIIFRWNIRAPDVYVMINMYLFFNTHMNSNIKHFCGSDVMLQYVLPNTYNDNPRFVFVFQRDDCNFIQLALPKGEIYCCDDRQCLTTYLGIWINILGEHAVLSILHIQSLLWFHDIFSKE